ncbi:DUF4856 domain-containing protein [Curvivirga sp.]|uniref:DUF4856 domain-containing protein n=1 Tax=Curvivirga sp. TaxID=2856848 RepID=UPI003B5A49D6
MKLLVKLGATALSVSLLSSTVLAGEPVYSGFPVTVKGYEGDKKTSVAYTGQIARQVLHDSLKKLAGKGNGQPNEELKAQMMSYFEGKDAGRAIIAPKTKGDFIIAETDVDSISKKKNLAGKTYSGVVTGMPNGMTGAELVTFWIDKASSANKGEDLKAGYNYPQLISKFLMGAVMYNQAVDNYLDEKLSADKKPNDKPYKDGAYYTGKEHAWDEAFGYFGAPAHTLSLSPKEVYGIAKLGSKSDDPVSVLKLADANGDGKVNMKSEMVFGPAYYAAGADKGGKSNYLHTITKAFIDGRQLIADANGEKLTDAQRDQLKKYASVIESNWEKVLAEATFKYAGSVYKDMQKLQTIKESGGDVTKAWKAYVKHWGELKGFALALQTGRNNLAATATQLNRLIGYSPLTLNNEQVSDISANGDYLSGETMEWGIYMLHMARVQKLLDETFGLKAKSNDVTGEMAALTDSLGDALSAETD